MTLMYKERLIGCRGVGMPLSLSVWCRADDTFRDGVSQTLSSLAQKFGNYGYLTARYVISGDWSKERIRLYSEQMNTTLVHEDAHDRMNKVWSDVECSWDESFAYATADYLYGLDKNIDRKVAFSQRCCRLHDLVQNGVMKSKPINGYLEDAENLAKQTGLGLSKTSWAHFLNEVHNFRYYSLMMGIFREYGLEEGDRRIFRATVIAQLEGLGRGIERLIRDSPARGIVINGSLYGRDRLIRSGLPVFNMVPVWKPGTRTADGQNAKVKGKKGNIELKSWTLDPLAAKIIEESVGRKIFGAFGGVDTQHFWDKGPIVGEPYVFT